MNFQRWTACLAAAALMISSASVASAYNIHIEARNPGGSDTITVDVFLDASPGSITAFSVGVLSDSAGLVYDPVASAAAEIIHPQPGFLPSGAQPSYILDYDHICVGMHSCRSDLDAYFIPFVTPAFAAWPTPPAGKQQVNIEYYEPSLRSNPQTADNIWIATLVYQIVDMRGGAIELTLSGDTAVYYSELGFYDLFDDVSDQVTLTGGPILVLPEPTTVLLIGLGLLSARAASRKR